MLFNNFVLNSRWDSVCFVVAERAIVLLASLSVKKEIWSEFQQDCWMNPNFWENSN
jgi:hypothetical protein